MKFPILGHSHCSSLVSVAVLNSISRSSLEEEVYLTYTSMTKSITEVSQDRTQTGNFGAGIEAGRGGTLLTGFLIQLGHLCLGGDTVHSGPHQSLIKKMAHRHAHQPIP